MRRRWDTLDRHEIPDIVWDIVTELEERYLEAADELHGPEGYDPDTKNEMRANGEWDQVVAAWSLTDQRKAELEQIIDQLDFAEGIVWDTTMRALERKRKRGYW